MKRFIFVVLFTLFSLFVSTALFLPPVFAADDWTIKSFDSDITIQSNGEVLIKETINATFDVSKHGIFRDIPYIYWNGQTRIATEILVESITRNGVSEKFEEERNNANLRLKIGDEHRTISGDQTYIITYLARGVLLTDGSHDELYWDATGDQWDTNITTASAIVRLPEPGIEQYSCYQGYAKSTEQCTDVELIDEQTIRFETNKILTPGEGLTVAVGYTKGMVPILTVAPPKSAWEEPLTWPTLGTFSVVSLLGIGFLVRQWLRGGRDYWYGYTALATDRPVVMPFGTKEAIGPEYEPPEKLRPAEIGVLVDERAHTLDVTATIVDLASRGYLTITEVAKKWRFGQQDYLLTQKKNADSELLNYEEELLNSLFATGQEVKISELKNKFYDDLAKVKKKLYEGILEKGLFTRNPDTVRNNYIGGGVAFFMVGVLGMLFSVNTNPIDWLLGLFAGFIFLGIAFTYSAHAMPARTAKGRLLYRQALGYQLFISSVEKYRAPFYEKENIFNEVLPYAIVFGLTERLAKSMDQLGVKPQNQTWYHGVHPFHPTVFASDVNRFSSTLSTAMASTPSGSGSGGGGGGSW